MKQISAIFFFAALSAAALAQPGTEFNYQGHLQDGSSPVEGTVSLRFTLYDSATAGSAVGSSIERIDTTAQQGLVNELLDFGDVFSGESRWLEVEVDSDGGSDAFATLSPRVQILPVPYSMYAEKAGGVDNFIALLSEAGVPLKQGGTTELSMSDYASGTATISVTYLEPIEPAPQLNFGDLNDYITVTSNSTTGFTAEVQPVRVTVDDSANNVGAFASMAVLQGHPAIAYQDATAGALRFARATNSTGTSWGTPKVLDSGSGTGTNASLATINNQTGIAYGDSDGIQFISSIDQVGNSWGTPTTAVPAPIAAGRNFELFEFQSLPAIGYPAGAVVAVDPMGMTWNSPISGTGPGTNAGFAAVNGEIISLYGYAGIEFLATTTSAAQWDTPVSVSAGVTKCVVDLEIINSFPVAAYHNFSDALIFAYFPSSNGVGAITTNLAGNQKQNGRTVDLVIEGEEPTQNLAIVRINTSNGLDYIEAADSIGTSWSSMMPLSSGVQAATDLSAVSLDEGLAIAYQDATDLDLKYLFYPTSIDYFFDEFNPAYAYNSALSLQNGVLQIDDGGGVQQVSLYPTFNQSL